jgi:hypothetical protein
MPEERERDIGGAAEGEEVDEVGELIKEGAFGLIKGGAG